MTDLYLASAYDAPHYVHPYKFEQTACGVSTREMRLISEAQALVFLGDRRCKDCTYHLDKIARGTR